MGEIKTYRCNQCGRLKGEANCWWLAGEFPDRYRERGFYIGPMAGSVVADSELTLCGFECATKKLAEFMTKAVDVQPKPAASICEVEEKDGSSESEIPSD